MAKRRKFSEEFKREAVHLTYQPGASVSQVARDIGVGSNLLFRWRRALKEDGKAFRARVWLVSAAVVNVPLLAAENVPPGAFSAKRVGVGHALR